MNTPSGRPIRLFVSDIDGTLVRNDKSLPDAEVEAVQRLQAAGVVVSVISARPVSGMLDIVRRLGVTGPIGAYNGGTIAQPDGTVISAARLTRETASEALRRLDQDWTTVWVFADGLWHTRTTDNAHNDSERRTTAQEPTMVKDFTGLLDRVDKMVGVSDEPDRLAALEAETAKALGPSAAVARSQTYYLDITAPEANKGAGVTAIAKAHRIPLAETAVIGDGGNDTRMFAVAGFSIAMGNGSDAVRGAADEVTASNMEDGVAAAIDRFVLPRVARRVAR